MRDVGFVPHRDLTEVDTRWSGRDVNETRPQKIGDLDVLDRTEPGVLHLDRPRHLFPHRGRENGRDLGDDHRAGIDLDRRGGAVLKGSPWNGAVDIIYRDDIGPRDRVAVRRQVKDDGERLSGRKFVARAADRIDVPDQIRSDLAGIVGEGRTVVQRQRGGAGDVRKIGVGHGVRNHNVAGILREAVVGHGDGKRSLVTQVHLGGATDPLSEEGGTIKDNSDQDKNPSPS